MFKKIADMIAKVFTKKPEPITVEEPKTESIWKDERNWI
jgi:hypothetical protein